MKFVENACTIHDMPSSDAPVWLNILSNFCACKAQALDQKLVLTLDGFSEVALFVDNLTARASKMISAACTLEVLQMP